MKLTDKEKKLVYDKIYYEANKEKKKAFSKIYRKANKEKMVAYDKKYYQINKKKRITQCKEYYQINKKKVATQYKKYYQINKEKITEQKKRNRKANPEKTKAKDKRANNKRQRKPNYKINNTISTSIGQSLKNGNGKNGYHWEDLLSYTLNDLIKRLKKTLPAGYTWNDYINGKTDLHIDHIIPISAHNFKSYTDTDFQRCWALKNLQLLPAEKNIKKGTKLTKHFQPSLLL